MIVRENKNVLFMESGRTEQPKNPTRVGCLDPNVNLFFIKDHADF